MQQVAPFQCCPTEQQQLVLKSLASVVVLFVGGHLLSVFVSQVLVLFKESQVLTQALVLVSHFGLIAVGHLAVQQPGAFASFHW